MRVIVVTTGRTCEQCYVIAWGGERWWVSMGRLLCDKCGGPMWED